MKSTTIVPVYALTLLISAALLFSIQPMFSKMILPMLGGTPQVWNTAMLFFQTMLLAGYAYAHLTSRLLRPGLQAVIHIVLLFIFTIALPIAIPPGWMPPVDRDPTIWQLSLMAITVGGPFFVLAGSAPMFQHWFTASGHKDSENPYFLYGASNLGSMTALFAYPTLIEPALDLDAQSHFWMMGYYALIALTILSAFYIMTHGRKLNSPPVISAPVSWALRLTWVVLAFVPSSLMLGVTTYVTTDVAAVPLIWVVPLAIYVGTFIIVFARKPLFTYDHILMAHAILMVGLIGTLILRYDSNPVLLMMFHIVLFASTALMCHTELARLRPPPGRLTEFYLLMSLGGALGGVFNAIIAPQFFTSLIEYPIALIAAVFLRGISTPPAHFRTALTKTLQIIRQRGTDLMVAPGVILFFVAVFGLLFSYASLANNQIPVIAACLALASMVYFTKNRWAFAFLVLTALCLYPPGQVLKDIADGRILLQNRNFFGVIKVMDLDDGKRILLHGVTNHGSQSLDEKFRLEPLAYYTKGFSPLADAFSFLDRKQSDQKIAVLGLGVGVMACFDKPDRSYDFYEIDPAVAKVAEDKSLFTFLSDCGSPYEIILGDGRLTMAQKPNQIYDLIVMDAFTSDNIPAHLLTVEAIEMYMKKLKPDGILIFNISNKFVDIEPVLTRAGKSLNVRGMARADLGGTLPNTKIDYYGSVYFSMSNNKTYNDYLASKNWSEGRAKPGVNLWTDRFSNIFSVLGNTTSMERMIEIHAARAKTLENKTSRASGTPAE